MITRPFLLHALTPLHAGTGQADEVVDLATARMKAAEVSLTSSSSIKGALRATGATRRRPCSGPRTTRPPTRERSSSRRALLGEAPAWDRDEIQARRDALLAYQPGGRGIPPARPARWLDLLDG